HRVGYRRETRARPLRAATGGSDPRRFPSPVRAARRTEECARSARSHPGNRHVFEPPSRHPPRRHHRRGLHRPRRRRFVHRRIRVRKGDQPSMKIDVFEMERMQSTWENIVELDMSESGVRPVSLRELGEMGLDLDEILSMPLGYSQSNGTIPLREELAQVYAGASPDHIEVTNGTSEANYLLALALLREGDEVALQVPNYMQYGGVPKSLGAKVNTFRLRIGRDW